MQTRSSNSSTTTVLIAVLLVLSFPFWIGILGGLLGLIIGIFGGVIGAIGGIIGGIFGAIGGLIGWIFDWNFHFPFIFWNHSFFTILAIVLLIVILTKSRK
ncbi:MAG TPA: hypothetical protein VIN08_00585 [Ohtaekwangia sp.]|uniref:hypothetical protein n=1 Tax=Ohtaekwangia sp. TaxID=2066019 RepID=UPI002F93E649